MAEKQLVLSFFADEPAPVEQQYLRALALDHHVEVEAPHPDLLALDAHRPSDRDSLVARLWAWMAAFVLSGCKVTTAADAVIVQ